MIIIFLGYLYILNLFFLLLSILFFFWVLKFKSIILDILNTIFHREKPSLSPSGFVFILIFTFSCLECIYKNHDFMSCIFDV